VSNDSEVLKAIQSGQSQDVELRSRISSERVLAQIISGFANSGGGRIVVGADENGINGLSDRDATLTAEWIRKVGESLLPESPAVEWKRLNGRSVVIATIPPAPTEILPVRTADGRYYRRSGRSIMPGESASFDESVDLVDRIAKVFVAMSFHFEEEPALVDYYESIRRAAAKSGLPIDVRRIDLLEGDFEIMERTEKEIAESDIVILDFTLNSPNVYYEAGIARGFRKYSIRCARKGTGVPFDVQQYKIIFYNNATQLEAALVPAIAAAYHDVFKISSSRAQ
jgi:hypothetical protein